MRPKLVAAAAASLAALAIAGPAAAGNAADPGAAVFAKAGCVACHTLKAAGAKGAVGPNLDKVKPSAKLVTERVTKGKGIMPSFKGKLSSKDIAAVAAYVSKVAGK